MKKIAIIGSGEFQIPLIKCAKKNGYETHVFSWDEPNIYADHFYRISIVEKEDILQKCKEINIDGICSIASDLANITVCYIANKMNLIGNSIDCTLVTTNKYLMRNKLKSYGVPIPDYCYLGEDSSLTMEFNYPVIVKPADRSGSRGISLINCYSEIDHAIKIAQAESFSKEVLIEKFITGNEYSVEAVSYNGIHKILQITEKFTTGSPSFIEIGHTCPARIIAEQKAKVVDIVNRTLDAVGITYGASHTELKISNDNEIFIIEIGSRMGGDYIGSDLVYHSTGFNFLEATLAIAMDDSYNFRKFTSEDYIPKTSSIRFIMNRSDFDKCNNYILTSKDNVVHHNFDKFSAVNNQLIKSSADRLGHLFTVDELENQSRILNQLGLENDSI
ncbi:ATP-grasp domain-containing protein [Vibrio metschnikovii]|nr:ATP-grasp domain-containing protein [Vibrio metschnikovii]